MPMDKMKMIKDQESESSTEDQNSTKKHINGARSNSVQTEESSDKERSISNSSSTIHTLPLKKSQPEPAADSKNNEDIIAVATDSSQINKLNAEIDSSEKEKVSISEESIQIDKLMIVEESNQTMKLDEFKNLNQTNKLSAETDSDETDILDIVEESDQTEKLDAMEDSHKAEKFYAFENSNQIKKLSIETDSNQTEKSDEIEDSHKDEKLDAFEDSSQTKKLSIETDLNQIEKSDAIEDSYKTEKLDAVENSNQIKKLSIETDSNEIDKLDAFEDSNQAKKLNVETDLNKSEKVNAIEDSIQNDKLNATKDLNQTDKLDIVEESNQTEKLDAVEDLLQTEKLDVIEDSSQAEKLDAVKESHQTEKLKETEDSNQTGKSDDDSKKEETPKKRIGHCKHCREMFVDIERIAINLTSKKLMVSYKECKKGCHWCYICKDIIPAENDMKEHMLVHLENNDVKCEYCFKKELTSNSEQHMIYYPGFAKKMPLRYNRNIMYHKTLPECYQTGVYCKRCKHQWNPTNPYNYSSRRIRNRNNEYEPYSQKQPGPFISCMQNIPYHCPNGRYMRYNEFVPIRQVLPKSSRLPVHCERCNHTHWVRCIEQNNAFCKKCFGYCNM